MTRVFSELINRKWNNGKFLCVGPDSDRPKIPQAAVKDTNEETLLFFNSAIIDATCDLVCAYKLQSAFYESLGVQGWSALKRTVAYINKRAPEVPIIGDMNRGDSSNTNLGYVRAAFEYFNFDAITLHPFLGIGALQPFLDRPDKGCFILCRTSNKEAKEFQDLYAFTNPRELSKKMSVEERYKKICEEAIPFYLRVARDVVGKWNKNGNCGLVVSATCPKELKKVRREAPDLPILLPDIGIQGCEVRLVLKYGLSERKKDVILNSVPAIIFGSSGPDFAEVARQKTIKIHAMINGFR